MNDEKMKEALMHVAKALEIIVDDIKEHVEGMKAKAEGATHEKENVDTKGDKASGGSDQMGAQV